MFHALRASLSDGQSYEDVVVYEEHDLEPMGIPLIFEEWTGCILTGGERIIVHTWKMKVIHIDKKQRSSKNSTFYNRLILDGNISYENITVIPHIEFEEMGIPHYFISRSGIAGQLTYSCQGGTYITHDTNVTSMIIPDTRRVGISASAQPLLTPQKLMRQSALPKSIQKRIVNRIKN